MRGTKLYRRALRGDASVWWSIRNDEEALFWSGNKRPIEADEHLKWWDKSFRDFHQYLAVHAPDELVNAYGRIQMERQAEVSLGVAESARRQGIGAGMLTHLEREARRMKIERLVAYVHPSNIASMRTFMRQGYVLGGHPMFQRLEKPL